jgi:hypothetical protein
MTTSFQISDSDKALIVKIVREVLTKEGSAEEPFVEDFFDAYLQNIQSGNLSNDLSYLPPDDLALGLGGDILLTALLLPIVVNLVTEVAKKQIAREKISEDSRKRIADVLGRELHNKRMVKRLTDNIIHQLHEG